MTNRERAERKLKEVVGLLTPPSMRTEKDTEELDALVEEFVFNLLEAARENTGIREGR